MGEVWIQENHVEERDNGQSYSMGDSNVYESWADKKDIGSLFKDFQKEYGRCTSKCYIDQPDGSSSAIGWVFSKRRTYEDSPKQFYTHTVWVSLHNAPPKIEKHYSYIYI